MSRMPCDACTRPGLPTSIFGFRAFCKSGGSQPISSSAPPSMSTSAVRNLQTKLGKFRRIPGQVYGDARARLAHVVIGEERGVHVQIISTDAGDPAFLETPKHLRVEAPVVKRFRDGEGIIEAASGFEAAIH